jgi:hypothetical protein
MSLQSDQLLELARIHTDILGGKGYGLTTNSDDAYEAGHIPFDEQGEVMLPNVGVTATILEFTVPDGYNGYITQVSNNTRGWELDPTAQAVMWRVTADNRPIRNFDRMFSEKGTRQIPREIQGIRIYGGQVIKMEVQHISDAALTGPVTGSLSGRYFPDVVG